jgi:REP element-mobilizing transposase RayT
LAPGFYRGRTTVFWTHTLQDRATGWLSPSFHHAFREIALHAAIREHVCCPIYTLMPDHLHLIWMGLSKTSDQLRATTILRKQLAPALRPHCLQHQSHDRVLRPEEREKSAFAAICRYIAENPMRARLCPNAAEWSYTGCLIPGYFELHPLAPGFWDKFWRIYNSAIERGEMGKATSY